jgi:hypothetical protein
MNVMSNETFIVEANRPLERPRPDPATPAGEVSIACHDTVPPFLEAELDALYQHINSSLSHFAVARRARDAHVYVARCGQQPLAIFLYQHEGRSIVVFNEMMQVPTEEIERFANHMFSRFPSVVRIAFSKIGKDIGALSLPRQQYGDAEDIVVSLPDMPDAYFSRLGSKLRHNIRHQMKALAADFHGFSFMTFENGAINENHVLGLIDLKKINMDEKRIPCNITPDEAVWLIQHARTNGLLVVALLDGKVCGGSLSFRLGDHYFAYLNGYDPRFAKYSLGMLCCYLAMKEKIERGAKEAHLLWGRNQYKFKLLGVAREVANLDIYRSRATYYRSMHRVLRNAFADFREKQKMMLLECEQRSGFLPSLVGRVVKTMRKIKRSSFQPTG